MAPKKPIKQSQASSAPPKVHRAEASGSAASAAALIDATGVASRVEGPHPLLVDGSSHPPLATSQVAPLAADAAARNGLDLPAGHTDAACSDEDEERGDDGVDGLGIADDPKPDPKVHATILKLASFDKKSGVFSAIVFAPEKTTYMKKHSAAVVGEDDATNRMKPQAVFLHTLPPPGTELPCDVVLAPVPKQTSRHWRVATWGPPGVSCVAKPTSMADVAAWMRDAHKSHGRTGFERHILHVTSDVGPFRVETVGLAEHSVVATCALPPEFVGDAGEPLRFRIYMPPTAVLKERTDADYGMSLLEPFDAADFADLPVGALDADPARVRRPTFVGGNEVLFPSLFLRPDAKKGNPPISATTAEMPLAMPPATLAASVLESPTHPLCTGPASGLCRFYYNKDLANAPAVPRLSVTVVQSLGSGHYTDMVSFDTSHSTRMARSNVGTLHLRVMPEGRFTCLNLATADEKIADTYVKVANVDILAVLERLQDAVAGAPVGVTDILKDVPVRPPARPIGSAVAVAVAAGPAEPALTKKQRIMASVIRTTASAAAAHAAALVPVPDPQAGIVAIMAKCDEKSHRAKLPKSAFHYADGALTHKLPPNDYIHVVNRLSDSTAYVHRSIKVSELDSAGQSPNGGFTISTAAGRTLLHSLNALWRIRHTYAFLVDGDATLADIGLGEIDT